MTRPNDTTRPISVAELLAKNGTHGAPVPTRRRRRRGNADAVTVAELTGEIPIITDETNPDEHPAPELHAHRANGRARVEEEVVAASAEEPPAEKFWSEPEPRWPASAPPRPREEAAAAREQRPQRSAYPRPVRDNVRLEADRPDSREDKSPDRSGAEGMIPDPLEGYAGMPVDVMDADVRDAEPAIEDSAYVRSYLRSSTGKGDVESLSGAGYQGIDDVADEKDYPEDGDSDEPYTWSRSDRIRLGGVLVLQSLLAVGFGAGLFIAFDQLWRWNNIIALVLTVLVILGLVIGVRVVRKTEDIGSTLIAVAVGALVTLGPLALLQSG
ncbi:hypothetical protein [Mycobacterium sp.]|uniref:hypothetical protein n=1 Tax=Mycobacterium sp. TaxID=1785 RepID=UPI0031D7788D